MSSWFTPWRAELGAWLLLSGSLAAGIGYEIDWGRNLVPQPKVTTPAASPRFDKPDLATPFSLPPPDQFLETSMRPVFLVTRRPAPVPPPPEPPKPSMQRNQFELTGTTILPEGKFAFLLEKATNKVRVVAEGKEVNGIRVKEVSPDRAILTQFDDTEVLILKTRRPATVPIIPGAVPIARRPPPAGDPGGQATLGTTSAPSPQSTAP